MFKDTQNELKRLEKELLWEQEQEKLQKDDSLDALLREVDALLEEDTPVYQNYSNGYGAQQTRVIPAYRAYNSDKTDRDLQVYSDEVYEPQKEKGIVGLIVTAAIELAAIFVILAYWAVRFL